MLLTHLYVTAADIISNANTNANKHSFSIRKNIKQEMSVDFH